MLAFLTSYAFMALCVVGSVAVAIGGILLVRKFTSHEHLQPHHEVAGPFISITATIFAVVLGFMVVGALDTFQQARVTVEQEANAIHDIFHMANALPEPTRTDIRRNCIAYADAMVNYEWPEMQQARASMEGHQAYVRIWHDMARFTPKSSEQSAFVGQILECLRTAGDCRHTRLIASQPAYQPILWAVLLIGSGVTIVFTYFFGVESLRVQILMTSLVTVVLALNLAVIALFSTPFSGDVHVAPTAFVADLDWFKIEVNEH